MRPTPLSDAYTRIQQHWQTIEDAMADSSCKHCYGGGFDVNGRICISHLEEAYNEAIRRKDIELAAIIVLKQQQLQRELAETHK